MAALGGTCGSGIVLLLAVLSLIAVGADAVLCPAAKTLVTGEAHPGCRDREAIERGRCLCGTEGLFLNGTKQVGNWAEVMYLLVAPLPENMSSEFRNAILSQCGGSCALIIERHTAKS